MNTGRNIIHNDLARLPSTNNASRLLGIKNHISPTNAPRYGAIAKRNVVIRWAAVYALIMFIIIFGAYGKGYVAVDPIYANF